MTDGGTERPRLLQRQDAGRIRADLRFRRKQVAADGLEDEVRTDVAATGQLPVRLAPAQILNPPHEVIAFDVRIERDGRTQGQRGLTAVPNRIDGDDLDRP